MEKNKNEVLEKDKEFSNFDSVNSEKGVVKEKQQKEKKFVKKELSNEEWNSNAEKVMAAIDELDRLYTEIEEEEKRLKKEGIYIESYRESSTKDYHPDVAFSWWMYLMGHR